MNTPEHIPFFDLSRQYAEISDDLQAAISDVLASGAFCSGPYVAAFEEKFAAFCGTSHAIGVNSGTSALHLALIAAGVQAGDEVILPANTFIATAWAVSYAGATPVFVDCHPDTWTIGVADVERKVTTSTKAIIGVSLYGQPFDVQAIQDIARPRQIAVIEDAAQSHGAKERDRTAGSFGDLGCFSFYPSKNLGACGEAGAITTDNPDFAAHLRRLRNHGSAQRYHHEELGFNFRMDGIQAAVLTAKLNHLPAWTARRRALAGMYHRGITNPAIRLQSTHSDSEPVYHLFVVTTEHRDRLAEHLDSQGVGSGLHYPVPCHLQGAYTHLGYKTGDFPNSEYLAAHCLTLPMFPELSDAEVDRVVETVNAYTE
jgi:dTDP-4-amino-4,6-dideoxygalactose transaminase